MDAQDSGFQQALALDEPLAYPRLDGVRTAIAA
jgi:hypothetical protein